MTRFLKASVLFFILAFIFLGYIVIDGATGTPNNLIVKTDANNYLLVTAVTQTNPITQGIFNSRTLRTDSTGSLQVILTGTVTPTYPQSIPASTCAAPSLGESGAATTGIAFTATPSILNCIGGATTTTLTSTLLTSLASMAITRGTITTDLPVRTDTVTWNAAGVTFTGWKLVVTDTASAAGSLLMDLGLSTGSQFTISKAGVLTTTGRLTSSGAGLQVASSAFLEWASRTAISSPSDGIVQFINQAGNNWTRVIFGTNSTATGGFSFEKDSGGHYNFARGDGSNGTLTVANIGANSCGTSVATIAGNDHVFVITVGATGGTACRVTFVTTWATAPICVANNETTAANLANANNSTTTTIDVSGTFVAGDKLGVICGTY